MALACTTQIPRPFRAELEKSLKPEGDDERLAIIAEQLVVDIDVLLS
jgi:hypothetical protein